MNTAKIKDFEIEDKVSGQHIKIKVGEYLTTLSVDGRDYFFSLEGDFDGTGSCLTKDCENAE